MTNKDDDDDDDEIAILPLLRQIRLHFWNQQAILRRI